MCIVVECGGFIIFAATGFLVCSLPLPLMVQP